MPALRWAQSLGGVNPRCPSCRPGPDAGVGAEGPFGALMVRYLNFGSTALNRAFWLRELSAGPAGPRRGPSPERSELSRRPSCGAGHRGHWRGPGAALSARGYHAIGLNRSGTRVPSFAEVYPIGERREALAGAEVVVSVVPATAETAGLLDEEALAALAPGALLMNVGRGSVVKEAALLAALESGHLGAAVLDVFDAEPLPDDHALWAAPRCFVTPHIAAPTDWEAVVPVFRENLLKVLGGEPPTGLVDPGRGY